MQKAWTPPARWIFLTATFLGLFSTLQAYRLTTLSVKVGMEVEISRLLVLNLVYWYVPAALTPLIFRLAQNFRVDSERWGRAVAIHVFSAGAFSVLHAACTLSVLALLWQDGPRLGSLQWITYAQRRYLTNLDWALMTYSAIVGLSYALGYHRESRIRAVNAAHLETRLIEARLRTLEAELHPHFLFNTLHAISTLVHTKPDVADRMISRLSDLLRITFDRSGAPRVSLQEELEFLQKYLEIEQTRFQDRLTVTFDIEPDTLDAEVPRLILQPLVENAIKHGVSPRSGPGLVRISARQSEGTLHLDVSDDGVGLSPAGRARLHNGVGLSNTRARLECLYGGDQRLEFSEPAAGLAVHIEFPFRTLPPGADEATPRVA